jgi:hypothetical protein
MSNEMFYGAYLDGFSRAEAPGDRPLELRIARALGAADHRDGKALRAAGEIARESTRRAAEVRASDRPVPAPPPVTAAPPARGRAMPSPEALVEMKMLADGIAAIGEARYEAMTAEQQAAFVAEIYRRQEAARRAAEEQE